MAVKLTVSKSKLKEKTKPKVTATKDATADAIALVPEACALKKKLAVLTAQAAAITKKLTPIETKISELVDIDVVGTESIDLINGENVLSVSAKGQLRSLKDTDDVVIKCEEFEEGLALKLAKFNLTDLDKYFTAEEMEVLCEVKEGKRRFKYN